MRTWRRTALAMATTEASDSNDNNNFNMPMLAEMHLRKARGSCAALHLYPSRAISTFRYAPGIITASHPLGTYAPGTMPEIVALSRILRRVPYEYDGSDGEEEDDLMRAETDEEALETILPAKEQLDAAGTRAAAAYEAQVWCELRSTQDHDSAGAHPRRREMRPRAQRGRR
jgi:hypothetical protein